MKYIEEFNITQLNMTQQYMQSVLSENTVILRKAIIKCITNLILFSHIIDEPSLYDLRIDNLENLSSRYNKNSSRLEVVTSKKLSDRGNGQEQQV